MSTRIRLSPEARKEQLLDLGVRLLRTSRLDEVSIDVLAEKAKISKGLLYHYFANKHEFHVAVVTRAVSDLFRLTAPPAGGDQVERLLASVTAYVDYVTENRVGYVSLVQAVRGGDETLTKIYEEGRAGLLDRLFSEAAAAPEGGVRLEDRPDVRLLVRGWSAMVEEMVLTWLEDPEGISREELVTLAVTALAGIVGTGPAGS